MLRNTQWNRGLEWSQPAPWSSDIRVSGDHFSKICGPPEHHLRSIKRFKEKKLSAKVETAACYDFESIYPLQHSGVA